MRDSLEKVRERMYGQFGGMQQSMQKLSQEIRVKKAAAPCDCLRKCIFKRKDARCRVGFAGG